MPAFFFNEPNGTSFRTPMPPLCPPVLGTRVHKEHLHGCWSALPVALLLPFMRVVRRFRGQVNALESIRMFSWSGSAALGG